MCVLGSDGFDCRFSNNEATTESRGWNHRSSTPAVGAGAAWAERPKPKLAKMTEDTNVGYILGGR